MAIPDYTATDRKEACMEQWRGAINKTYPNVQRRPLFVPALHFNRVSYDRERIGGVEVCIQKPMKQMSDVREDESTSRFYHALRNLFPCQDHPEIPGIAGIPDFSEEPVAVIFGLDFDNYLNGGGKEGTIPEENKKRTFSPATSPVQGLTRKQESRLHKTQTRPGPYNIIQSSKGIMRYTYRSPTVSPLDDYGSPPLSPTDDIDMPSTSNPFYTGWRTSIFGETIQVSQTTTHQADLSSGESLPEQSSFTESQSDLSLFTRPRDISPKDLQRGRFDVLMFHKQYGIIVMEVKAVGDAFNLNEATSSVASQQDVVRKKIHRSLKQLDKNTAALRLLLKDLDEDSRIPITKCLVLPNVQKKFALVAIMQDRELVKELCQCLEASTPEAALQQCIFSEQLPPIGQSGDAYSDVMQKLRSDWWLSLTSRCKVHCMDDELYISILARFCGPATKQFVNTAQSTRADVSTLHQAVKETHECFSARVLTADQVKLLNEDHDNRVFVCGPPGTGKSISLILKAMKWLTEGRDVLVVSLWEGSQAVSRKIVSFLEKEQHASRGTLRLLAGNDIEEILQEIVSHVSTRSLRTETETFLFGHTHAESEPYSDLETDSEREESKSTSTKHSLGREVSRTSFGQTGLSAYPGTSGGNVRHNRGFQFSPPSVRVWRSRLSFYPELGLPPFANLTSDDSIWKQYRNTAATSEGRRGMSTSPYSSMRAERVSITASSTSTQSRKTQSMGGRTKVCVVVDEAPWFLDLFVQELNDLLRQDQDLVTIWAASSFSAWKPRSFTEAALTQNLRCPPAVVREMMTSRAYVTFARPQYTSLDTAVLSGMPYPTEGLPVKRIDHCKHGEGRDVWQCELCGKEVARFLIEDLQIRQDIGLTTGNLLHFKDVLVSGYVTLSDDSTRVREPLAQAMWFGTRSQPGFLEGLEVYGVSNEQINCPKGENQPKPADQNCVQVAEPESILGLEFPVVVVIGTNDVRATYPRHVDPWFDVMSRCTSQLVLVGDVNKPSWCRRK